MTESISLKELALHKRLNLLLVSKAIHSNPTDQQLTDATYQKVMSVIQSAGREFASCKEWDITPPAARTKLTLVEGTHKPGSARIGTLKVVRKPPDILISNVLFVADAALFIEGDSVMIIRWKFGPAGTTITID